MAAGLSSENTQPQPVATADALRRVAIGLPAAHGNGERCFPLTPEAVRWLVDSYRDNTSLSVKIEAGAARDIHYTDARYARYGACVCDRAATLRADIVITAAGLDPADISSLLRGAMWITLLAPEDIGAEALKAAAARHITVISLMRVTDATGNCHIADTLAEVDGRAAITVAAGLLADNTHGKGILLGGIAGIIPCEVVVIGAGIAGMAAAKSAAGLGATVRVFDDDPSRLRILAGSCAGAVIPSSLHREVFLRAVTKADIIINTMRESSSSRKAVLSADDIAVLKNEVIVIDTVDSRTFPSLRHIELSQAYTTDIFSGRFCFVNAACAVPRTASMAISNSLVPLLEKMISATSALDPIRIETGLKNGLVTIGGQIVSREAAAAARLNFVDPSIYLHLS